MAGIQLLYFLLLLEAGACTPVLPTAPAEEMDPCAQQDAYQGDIKRWPGGIIPYILDESLADDAKEKLLSSMHRCENTTCTLFVPWTNQLDYVLFEEGERCCSFNGRSGGGMQRLSVCDTCIRDLSVDYTIQNLTGVPKQQHTTHPQHDESGSKDRESTGSPFSQVPLNRVENDQAEEFNNVSRCTDLCGGCIELNPYTNKEGTLNSPRYPSHYQTNVDCGWKLFAPFGYAITLTFYDIDVEWERSCSYDYVDIFNMDTNGDILRYEHICGSHVPAPISTTSDGSDTVIIQFHSDESYTGRGFHVRYALEVRSEKLNCTFDNGGCSQLCLADTHGLRTACDCKEGYSLAQDGHTCVDINECKHKRGGCQQKCTNTEGSFQCHCKTGFSLNTDGITCRECGSHHNATTGVILSPGYPAPYPAFQNCYWTIGVHADHYLKITIANLDITRSDKCEVDYLKVEHGHFPHMRRLCGYLSEVTYVISQSMYIRFHTEDINALRSSGFMLSYTQVPAEEATFLDLEYVIVDGKYVPYRQRLWI